MALKAENVSKCCVRSDGKGEAQLRLLLDKGQTQGEEQGRDAGTAFIPQLSKQGPAAFPVPPPGSHPLGPGTASSPSEQGNAELSASVGSWGKTYSFLAVKGRVWAFHPQPCFLWPSCATLCSTGLQSSFSSVNSSISYMFTLGNAGKVSVCFKWNVTTVRSYWEKWSYHPARSVGCFFYNSIEKWDSNSHMLHPSHFKEECV